MSVHPAKTQISLGISDQPGHPDVQADLSLHWAHTHFVGFVMSRLKCHAVDYGVCIPGMVLSRMNAITGPQNATLPTTITRTMSKVSLPKIQYLYP